LIVIHSFDLLARLMSVLWLKTAQKRVLESYHSSSCECTYLLVAFLSLSWCRRFVSHNFVVASNINLRCLLVPVMQPTSTPNHVMRIMADELLHRDPIFRSPPPPLLGAAATAVRTDLTTSGYIFLLLDQGMVCHIYIQSDRKRKT